MNERCANATRTVGKRWADMVERLMNDEWWLNANGEQSRCWPHSELRMKGLFVITPELYSDCMEFIFRYMDNLDGWQFVIAIFHYNIYHCLFYLRTWSNAFNTLYYGEALKTCCKLYYSYDEINNKHSLFYHVEILYHSKYLALENLPQNVCKMYA